MSTPQPSGRLTTLDGLRGVAALVVLVHHGLLVVPVLAMPYFNRGTPATGSWPWWITYTPLHALWNGTVAVYVFFVLSGLVLTLPATRPGRIRWRAYYPRRLVRLYGPVWVAVALAYAWILAVPRHRSKALSAWMNWHHRPRALDRLLQDLFLHGEPGQYNSPLWSLKYEVMFSLLLPLFVVAARYGRRFGALKALACVGIGMWGVRQHNNEALYLPLFGLGALMAVHRERLREVAERLLAGRRRAAWSVGMATAALVLTNTAWQVRAVLAPERPSPDVVAFAYAAEMLGAALVVYLAWCWTPWARVLDSRACGWLGSRSFSLYLVHEPVIVSFALLLGPRYAAATLLVSVPVVVAATEGFYRLVERPFIGIARSTGHVAERLFRSADTSTAEQAGSRQVRHRTGGAAHHRRTAGRQVADGRTTDAA